MSHPSRQWIDESLEMTEPLVLAPSSRVVIGPGARRFVERDVRARIAELIREMPLRNSLAGPRDARIERFLHAGLPTLEAVVAVVELCDASAEWVLYGAPPRHSSERWRHELAHAGARELCLAAAAKWRAMDDQLRTLETRARAAVESMMRASIPA